MLAAWLLVALWSLAAGSLAVFTPAARRGVAALAAVPVTVAALAVAVGVSLALGARPVFAVSGAAVAGCAIAVWTPATRRWGAIGRVVWGSAVWAGALYLAYLLEWTFRSRLGVVGTAGGLLLWVLEASAYLLGLAFLWEAVDVLASAAWRRRVVEPPLAPEGATVPFVSLHVPAHNEPPEMVIATLSSLLALDYPADRLEILMIDDNTDDPGLWEPVAEFAEGHPDRIRFFHLHDWPGFKSGALNFALARTDPSAEVVGVIDADYLADPDYLRRCAPLFQAEERLGFLQTPQDYREYEHAAYYRRLYDSYAYFFDVSQLSRNERDGAIFGGTMGLIRRRALAEVGGWDEWCITEDAELSLRLLRAGWSGRHIDRSFGRGIMPLTFDALKRQRYRWCFGGIQILRMHWRSLLPWKRDPDNRLTLAQRLAYLVGGLQWYGDVLGLAFAALLLLATVDQAVGAGVVFRRMNGFLLVAVPSLAALGVGRSLVLLRRTSGSGWRQALGAFGIWLALGWTVACASLRGAVAPAGVFLRTPKTKGDPSLADAVRTNRVEAALATLGAGGMALAGFDLSGSSRWLLPSLLALPVAGMLAAPLNTVAALRADLPEELRRRRRTELLRAWTGGPLRPVRLVGAVAAGFVLAATTAVLLAPGGRVGPSADLLHEASGQGPRRVPVSTLPPSTTVPGAVVPATAAGGGRSPATTGGAGTATASGGPRSVTAPSVVSPGAAGLVTTSPT
ncbi:MAG TPA: glycosyltransferase, partial [Acidimicrobiales bacterium]|nr:glycosyltransferase [Acidimicrobiales bacterium]